IPIRLKDVDHLALFKGLVWSTECDEGMNPRSPPHCIRLNATVIVAAFLPTSFTVILMHLLCVFSTGCFGVFVLFMVWFMVFLRFLLVSSMGLMYGGLAILFVIDLMISARPGFIDNHFMGAV